ncbi:MAG: DUF4446 family protein [Carboxydocellales bacterium]
MLLQLVKLNLETVLVAIITLQGVILLVGIWALLRTRKITGKFKVLLKGSDDKNLEDILIKALELGKQNQVTLSKVLANQIELRTILAKCIQNQAVVRFDAYDNITGELSFAVALLDGNGDGIVLSNLSGRDFSRLYIKHIEKAKSKSPLSREEVAAINDALQT